MSRLPGSMSFFDVFTEMTIDDDCDGVSARRRLSSSNLGSSGQDGVEVQLACSPDSRMSQPRFAGTVRCLRDYGRTPRFTIRSMCSSTSSLNDYRSGLRRHRLTPGDNK